MKPGWWKNTVAAEPDRDPLEQEEQEIIEEDEVSDMVIPKEEKKEPKSQGSPRNDDKIATLLYGKKLPEDAGEADPGAVPPADAEKKPARTVEELAKTIYPPESPRYAKVTDDGHVERVIRDTAGNIMHTGGKEGDILDMIQYNVRQLANASLRGLDFRSRDLQDGRLQGADLKDCQFHGSLRGTDFREADLRGVSFENADLRFTDLTDARMDHETDFAGADLEGATYDFNEIRRCKNWKLSKNIRMNTKKR